MRLLVGASSLCPQTLSNVSRVPLNLHCSKCYARNKNLSLLEEKSLIINLILGTWQLHVHEVNCFSCISVELRGFVTFFFFFKKKKGCCEGLWEDLSTWDLINRKKERTERRHNEQRLDDIFHVGICWSPSSSDITISESAICRERGSDFGIGFITCNE